MTKNISLLFLLPVLFFSCTKKDINSGNQPLQTTVTNRTASTETDNPTMYLDLVYSESGFTLNMDASVVWPGGAAPDAEADYSIQFSISGPINPAGKKIPFDVHLNHASYTTNLSFSSSYQVTTVTVNATLMKGLTVITSTSQSLTILPVANASTVPANSMATVTINKTTGGGPYYDIKATDLKYLEGHPERKFYFYAFYFPTEYQRINQQMKPYVLGSTTIYGQPPLFKTEGGFTSYLPDGFDVSNIRVFLTKTDYPSSYFSNGLRIPNVQEYLIDWCYNDITMYDIPLQGLNTTNLGRFNSYSYPNSIGFYVGSMDQMLNMQIYYLKNRGFLW